MAYILAKRVRHQVADIWRRAQKDSGSTSIADALVDSFTECFILLAEHPHIGRTRDEDLRPGLRSYPVGNYTVIYRVTKKEDVFILRVYHGKRNVVKLFRR